MKEVRLSFLRPRIQDAIEPRMRTPRTDGTMITRLPKNAVTIRPSWMTWEKFSSRFHLVGRVRLGFSASAWFLPAVTTTSQKGTPSRNTISSSAMVGWARLRAWNRERGLGTVLVTGLLLSCAGIGLSLIHI